MKKANSDRFDHTEKKTADPSTAPLGMTKERATFSTGEQS
jgi:hypothetical protein